MKSGFYFFLLLQLLFLRAFSQQLSIKDSIIHKVIESHNLNNPDNRLSFTYISSNKIVFTIQEDTILKEKPTSSSIDSTKEDSIESKLYSFNKQQPIFSSEFISERHFKYPDKNIENVLSSSVSGLNDPIFALLTSQIQSIAFYNEYISLFDRNYLNPIHKINATYYKYSIIDTIFNYAPDTVFVISFNPIADTTLYALTGSLYINSSGYAIRSIIAAPAVPDNRFSFQIKQQFEIIENKQWFPSQQRTNLLLKNTKFKNRLHKVYYKVTGTNDLSNIKINSDISDEQFIQPAMLSEKAKQNDTLINTGEYGILSKRVSASYHIIDSLTGVSKLQNRFFLIDALIYKYITLGGFNIDYSRILNINKFEGIKTGLKIFTNPKIFNFASIGGFFVYGFHDKNWKYGGFVQLFPKWYSDTKLTVRFAKNVTETGGFSFLDDYVLNSSEFIRNYYVTKMDKVLESELSFTFRTLKYIKVNLFINHSKKTFNQYQYLSAELNSNATDKLNFTEAGIQCKFAFGEKFLKTPSGLLISLGTKYPVLWINFRYGSEMFSGQITYRKFETKLSKTFNTKVLGKTQIQVKAGKVFDFVPLSNLYSAQGCYEAFSFDVDNNFATLKPGEFYSKEFASIFFRQNFGSLIKTSKTFRPELHLVTNAGWGTLPQASMHQNIVFKTMEKGYYETGLLLHRIVNTNLMGMGIGVYYRYGPYQFEKTSNNIAYKLAISLSL